MTGIVLVVATWALNSVAVGAFGIRPPGGGGGFRVEVAPPTGQWVVALLLAVLYGFFLGGMFRMACLQVRGRRIAVADLFSVSDVLADLAFGSAFTP